MKILFYLLVSLFLPQAMLLTSMRNMEINRVMEMVGEKPESQPEVELPAIPKVVSDAKSLDVYNKKGKLYQQEAFNKLSNEEKEKNKISFYPSSTLQSLVQLVKKMQSSLH